ncbi:hypothetical protein JYQ62_26665 [Nostoc sp. UHCC 0702]|nr:hypothetical protein JYQ62_26665 [Nostoc sp. UHCC 0702]
MGEWGDGEMERWGDREMGRQDKIFSPAPLLKSCPSPLPPSPHNRGFN